MSQMKRVMTDQVKAKRVSDEAKKKKKARSWTVADLLCACVLSFTTWSLPVTCHGTDPVLQMSLMSLWASFSAHAVRRFILFPQSIDHVTEVLKSSVNAAALWCVVCYSTICFKSGSRSRYVHTSHHEYQLTGVFLDNSKTGVGTLLPSSAVKDSIVHALFILPVRLSGYFTGLTVDQCLCFEKPLVHRLIMALKQIRC